MSCPSFPGCASPPVELSSIVGTAPNEDAYLILELPKPWPAKIKKAEGLVERVRSVLKKHKQEDFRLLATPKLGWLPESQNVRALLLRWSSEGALCTVLEDATPDTIKAAIQNPAEGEPEELFLVCTHGSRDPCCGLKGVPLFRALTTEGSRKTLEVSHLGGHRFAPVVLAMPEWRFFGHLTPESALRMDTALASKKPFLEGYRGNGRLNAHTQVVEAQLWQEYGEALVSVKQVSGDKSAPEIEARLKDGSTLNFEATIEHFHYQGYKSCKDYRKEKMSDLKLPRLVSLNQTVC